MPRTAFAARIQDAIDASIQAGYNPTRMTEMLRTRHAVEVAKRMVISGDIQAGLSHWVQAGQPEMTMEGIMLDPAFAGLFTASELTAARWRLDQAAQQS
jgi:hypothetical protein